MTTELQPTGDKNSFLSPNNFEHYFRIANMMSKSDMVPKAYKDKPQDALIAMELGRTWNLGPLQAIQNIAVINGKPCAYGDLVIAICSSHPDFENIEESPIHGENGKVMGYVCTVKRKGRSPVTQSFTVEQATAAGLWGRQGPWKQYPERMLQMRARGFALRDSFADALNGVRIAEEVIDYEVKDITPTKTTESHLEKKDSLMALIEQNKNKAKEIQKAVDPETGEVLPDELQSNPFKN